eukprot:CAMPEP_0174893944 /NCGR_PEP_ID=MMETSP0167-20121228/8668_1 /TAXON_ID=38298 /ORGANISM="Rhodella maculata, Strain CCMP736" /LENGTH=71 /DNA_ID=CAMNT_0016132883 /DNA_START=884 /DNA_END=1099 /DNA_ORIENTATION=-
MTLCNGRLRIEEDGHVSYCDGIRKSTPEETAMWESWSRFEIIDSCHDHSDDSDEFSDDNAEEFEEHDSDDE